MTQEYKTLLELDVQPGDVVEDEYGFRKTVGHNSTGEFCHMTDQSMSFWGSPIWRIVSRSPDTPKPWHDMTPEEKGALLLANHDGKVIEIVDSSTGAWVPARVPGWWPPAAYRVRPEPKPETVTLHGNATDEVWGRGTTEYDTHRITFDLIDGRPDCDSIKMETL